MFFFWGGGGGGGEGGSCLLASGDEGSEMGSMDVPLELVIATTDQRTYKAGFRVETSRPQSACRTALTKWSDSSSDESSAHWLPETMAGDLGSLVMVTLSDGSTTPLLGDTSFGCCSMAKYPFFL